MTLHLTVEHRFAEFTLDLRLDIPNGVTALFGPSGSGKTTLVQTIAGLLQPQRGHISVDDWLLLDTARGYSMPPHKRQIGYIFQEGRLFPHLSVKQNLLYGHWFARSRDGVPNLATVVELLGIGHLLKRRPGALSGGEKQRVAIGRALLAQPRLILADEPLAALDEARKAEILPYLQRLRDEVALPIVYVSHSSTEVAQLANTVVMLEHGRVAAYGKPATVLTRSAFDGLFEADSTLTAWVRRHHDDGLTEVQTAAGPLWLPGLALPAGSAVMISVPARHIVLARQDAAHLSALNVLDTVVLAIAAAPDHEVDITLAVGAEHLTARLGRRAVTRMALAVGQRCRALLPSALRVTRVPSQG